jgi:hypothetical protein
LKERGEAEEKHVETQPDMGLETLEENVGGDLEENVWHKEDDEGGIVFGLFETKLFRKTKDVGIGNIDTVYELRDKSVVCDSTEDEINVPKKASKYMIQRKGMTWKSILAMSLVSVVLDGQTSWTSSATTPLERSGSS